MIVKKIVEQNLSNGLNIKYTMEPTKILSINQYDIVEWSKLLVKTC